MLDVHLALMLEIQKSNPKLPPPKAQEYASWVLEEASSKSIDPWVFHAIIHTETRWTARVVVHEKNGSCSIGLGGANVSCRSPDVVRLQNPQENIRWIGAFLVGIRGRCRYNCSGLGWVRAYNGGKSGLHSEDRTTDRRKVSFDLWASVRTHRRTPSSYSTDFGALTLGVPDRRSLSRR